MLDQFGPVSVTLESDCDPGDGKLRLAPMNVLRVHDLLKIDREVVLVRKIGKRRVRVDRGVGGTEATGHSAGTRIDLLGVAMPENAVTPQPRFFSNYVSIWDPEVSA